LQYLVSTIMRSTSGANLLTDLLSMIHEMKPKFPPIFIMWFYIIIANVYDKFTFTDRFKNYKKKTIKKPLP
jgi:hypothetical protein